MKKNVYIECITFLNSLNIIIKIFTIGICYNWYAAIAIDFKLRYIVITDRIIAKHTIQLKQHSLQMSHIIIPCAYISMQSLQM